MLWSSPAALLLGLLSARALGKLDKVVVTSTEFTSLPANLFYFEDSDVVLVSEISAQTVYRSTDAGGTFKRVEAVDEGKVLQVLKHPYNNNQAVIIGTDQEHWITQDQGETWRSWVCEDDPTFMRPAINFHADDPDRMIFMTADCQGFECQGKAWYTTDAFATKPQLLLDDAISCLWAKSTDLFTTGNADWDKNQVLCVVRGEFDLFSSNYRLLSSSNYFESETEPALNAGRTIKGVLNLAAVKSYLVAAAKSEGTSELAMYVSDDANQWHRAEFGEHRLEEDAYTLLESTNYSMQVDVLTTKPSAPMGVLLTSNSNGTFFTRNIEHTNRNVQGFVDFEKVQNIQGIVLVNVVSNWEEVERSWIAEKEIRSQISFDDGRTWQPLKAGDADLHLHSVTDQRNQGRIFSSPAPGIVMAIGNTGKSLETYERGDLFVSDDAGFTWTKAQDGPHFYEMGDQGAVLVAIEDAETNEIKYSLNHGQDWEIFKIKDKIRPIALTTVPDSTSLRFTLTAVRGTGSNTRFFIYSIGFAELEIRNCKDSDFEDWYARKTDTGEPGCIMGHTQKFRRRKRDAKCIIDSDSFQEPLPQAEPCKCTELDYECDFENGFTLEDGRCTLTGAYPQPQGACEGDKKTFMGSSGFRKIPGNDCVGGEELDKQKERECADLNKPVASGKIATEITPFKGDAFAEYYYLERAESNAGDDETVVMRTDRREAWLSRDHGKSWMQIVKDDDVVAIYPHQYVNERVYFVTPSKTVYYSEDRGANIHSFEAPEAPNQDQIQILGFHPKEQNWLIWTGDRDCDLANNCQTIAHVSQRHGDDWEPLLRDVRKCQFVYREDRPESDELVYCEQYDPEDKALLSLLSSTDFFKHTQPLKRNVINFATMAEFIVVAVRDVEQDSLQVDTSIDGQVFADAKFPPNFKVPHQQAYTVLDSSTHAVFLHVTVNNRQEQEYGSIVKSNSNGTSYVLSVSEVNRNIRGYVDFEKMQGLEGVAVINRVGNVEEVDRGSRKKLQTWITHNDGADWALIPRPVDPPNGDPFECKSSGPKCALHLHGYTERKDPRDTYSSPSAVGLMIGTGNVGEYLGEKEDADTFVTRDGGLTWTAVARGNWMWEYGDQGSIIVIVKETEPTDMILYSLDEGINWHPHKFSEKYMVVSDITTVPSDASRKFLLWGKIEGGLTTVALDFSGLEERSKQCKLDESNPEADDYQLWSPKHPLSDDNCLFGHVAQYHRKRLDSNCYNGASIQHLHSIKQNCSCTRQDFECDYNFERQSDGSCALVQGLKPEDPIEQCKRNPQQTEYYDITPYRRIPLTTCSGGAEMDYTSRSYPCPGHEPEYAKKHGISGFGLFLAIVLPITAAAGIGYYAWKHWDGKFGRIRLGGSDFGGGMGSSAFDRDAPWIRYPVMAVSAIFAVVAAIPMVVGSLWNAAATRFGRSRGYGYSRPYTSRSDFGRGRGGYGVVDTDDGELLGDDSEEEG